ncbi:MAG: hypothetical protein Q8P80_05105 [Candidatus Levybacteria bacterium]|nr:hypothetical protein [Candidatus Levybacteria bacterium]
MRQKEGEIFAFKQVSSDSQPPSGKEPTGNGIVEKYQDKFNAWLREHGVIKSGQVVNLNPEPFFHRYPNGCKSDASYYFDARVNNHHVFLSELQGRTTAHSHPPPTSELYILLEGEAKVTIDETICYLSSQNPTLTILSGQEHQVIAEGQRAVLLIIMTNPSPQRENLHCFRD